MERESKSGLVKNWIRERILFLALIIFVAGATAYIGADKVLGPGSIWLHPVKEFSLLISMIGVVSLGYELFLRELTFNEYKTALREIVNPDAVRLGITGIYKNRSELAQSHPFEELFNKAQHEIFIGGTSLLSISTSNRELLKEKITSGIAVRLLLMDPESKVVDFIAKQSGSKSTFVNEIKMSLLLLQKFQEEVEHETDARNKGRLLIHTYDAIPSHSFISLDAEESNGLIVTDIGPYLGRSAPRPSMMVANKKHGLYKYWQEMNNAMWEASKPIQHGSEETLNSRSKTIVLASGRETEYHDAKTGVWKPASICQISSSWRTIKGAQWVWIKDVPTLEEAKTGNRQIFRLRFDLPKGLGKSVVRADLFIRSKDTCRVAVNDKKLDEEYGAAQYIDACLVNIGKLLKGGENTVVFELASSPKPQAASPEDNRTGLIYRLDLEYRE